MGAIGFIRIFILFLFFLPVFAQQVQPVQKAKAPQSQIPVDKFQPSRHMQLSLRLRNAETVAVCHLINNEQPRFKLLRHSAPLFC